MNKLHKATMIFWTMLLVLSIMLVIWTPAPIVYFAIGLYTGGLVILLMNYPYINFLQKINDYFSKQIHKLLDSKIELMEELNKLYESINKKKKK